MSTPSRIGLMEADGITSVYCHWDGSPSWTKAMLTQHYQDPAKIKALLSYGDLSVLKPEVSPPAVSTHSFETPDPEVCVFYGRDRGETGTEACWSETVEEYRRLPVSYHYLFVDGQWKVID